MAALPGLGLCFAGAVLTAAGLVAGFMSGEWQQAGYGVACLFFGGLLLGAGE